MRGPRTPSRPGRFASDGDAPAGEFAGGPAIGPSDAPGAG